MPLLIRESGSRRGMSFARSGGSGGGGGGCGGLDGHDDDDGRGGGDDDDSNDNELSSVCVEEQFAFGDDGTTLLESTMMALAQLVPLQNAFPQLAGFFELLRSQVGR